MSTEPKIDEDLHSRQLAVYGRQAMGKLSATKVLVSGMNGLGVEIAKNIILAQVKGVTLHDTANTQAEDLGSQFYLTQADIGKNRAAGCVKQLQELNPTVDVTTSDVPLSQELVQQHDVVVLIGHTHAEASAASTWCRSRKTPARLIWCASMGLFGFVCNDFGEGFVVNDTTGENPRSAIVADIIAGTDTLVSCVDDQRIDFEEGDVVKFVDVEGMDGIEEAEFKVKDVQKTSFKIGDTTKYSKYVKGGTVVQVKQPKTLKYAPIGDAFEKFEGELIDTDWSKFGRPALLLLVLEALEAFRAEKQRLPEFNNEDDAKAVIALVEKLNEAREEKKRLSGLEDQSKLISNIVFGARAVLNPMAAFLGGVIGQEVVKAATGKFHPLHQWLLFESTECLPEERNDASDYVVPESDARYAHQIAVFGREAQQKIAALNLFMVGAGALGCEFLKNFAMMGVGTDEKGLVTLTDDDTIERSNLSRQFLFRNSDVGKSKSEAAGRAASAMNPDIHLRALQDRVSPLTEGLFNDEFWQKLSFVTNALDNVKARLYVDRRCVFFNKPLFESGTLGPKCNTQVVMPHITENYGASRDPPEKVVPQCTLHHFPHNIQHCLAWARSEFLGQFTEGPLAAKLYAGSKDGEAYVAQLRAAGTSSGEVAMKVEGLVDLVGKRPTDFAACVDWARKLYEDYFVHKIKHLTHHHPEDAVNNKSGQPFWAPPKRFPRTADFDAQDELRMGFVIAAANLRAVVSGLQVDQKQTRDPAYVAKLLDNVDVPEWKPKESYKEIKEGDDNNNQEPEEETDEETIKNMLASLPAPADLSDVQFDSQEFEKDDATNFHMDFIHAAANLRAYNYQIKEVDPLQSKLIAGKIIPAIATTTAAATGLVCLEIYKYLREAKLEDYRNAFVNLALPLFSLIEPMPPAKVKARVEKRRPDPIRYPDFWEEEEYGAYPEEFTVWDHLELDQGDLTLQEFIDYWKNEHKLTATSIAVPTMTEKGESAAMLYSSYSKSTHARLPKKFSELYAQVSKTSLDDRKYILPSVLFDNEEGIQVDTPEIIYRFRK